MTVVGFFKWFINKTRSLKNFFSYLTLLELGQNTSKYCNYCLALYINVNINFCDSPRWPQMDDSLHILISTSEKMDSSSFRCPKNRETRVREGDEWIPFLKSFLKTGNLAFTLDQLKCKVLSISRKATINSVFKTYIVHLNFYIVPHLFFVFPPKDIKI